MIPSVGGLRRADTDAGIEPGRPRAGVVAEPLR